VLSVSAGLSEGLAARDPGLVAVIGEPLERPVADPHARVSASDASASPNPGARTPLRVDQALPIAERAGRHAAARAGCLGANRLRSRSPWIRRERKNVI
jgi:hypothetical protein